MPKTQKREENEEEKEEVRGSGCMRGAWQGEGHSDWGMGRREKGIERGGGI